MIGRLFCFLLALQIVSLVSAVRKPFLPAQEVVLHSPPPYTTESKKGFMDIGTSETMQEAYDGVSKIGSSPPSCENKCYGCVPCEAIQVPSTSTRRSHLGIQYANYEPESWKCKCGPSFYSP
ncbi:hypothetical protein PHAVU_010G137100 [Phaseolus vulgaris]|uniref:Epidermal patterning factor-like protein n=1 Tax=Phaseolus vulgaris TaxID=3885 RepID=V7APL1_PHAVU|nr:hypothetical protein PHAVU_010G137100g [Phaseolus vulgaris]ESW07524.1 hypothetical protein PHAVU_010G137100g [Phaseolus vulgaris]